MKVYAVEVCDRWNSWHVAQNGYGQLCVFVAKEAAVEMLKEWTKKEVDNKMVREGVSWAGITCRVRPFNEKRIERKKRRKELSS